MVEICYMLYVRVTNITFAIYSIGGSGHLDKKLSSCPKRKSLLMSSHGDSTKLAELLLANMVEDRKQNAEDRREERMQHDQAMQFLQMQLVQRGEEQAQREVAHRIEMKELSE